MITKSKLKEWVDALPDGSVVGVGGCSLELVAQAPDSKGCGLARI